MSFPLKTSLQRGGGAPLRSPSPAAVSSRLLFLGPGSGRQEQAVRLGAVGRLAELPGAAPGTPKAGGGCCRGCWGALRSARLQEAARAAALERQEGTSMLVSTGPVSSGSEVSSFFLIGLNGKAHVERLSVFFLFLSFFSRQTAELFAQMCPCY